VKTSKRLFVLSNRIHIPPTTKPKDRHLYHPSYVVTTRPTYPKIEQSSTKINAENRMNQLNATDIEIKPNHITQREESDSIPYLPYHHTSSQSLYRGLTTRITQHNHNSGCHRKHPFRSNGHNNYHSNRNRE
jgi:hypothetical protein